MEDVEAAGMAKEETWRTWTHVLRWESRRAVEFVDGLASAFLNSAHHMDSGPSRAQSAPRSLRPALLIPQVNAGSLYRRGKRT